MASSSQIMRRVEPMSAGLRGKRASKAGQHEWRGAGAKPRAMRVDNTLVVGLGTAGGAAVARWGARTPSSRFVVYSGDTGMEGALDRALEEVGAAVVVMAWPATGAMSLRSRVTVALRACGVERVEIIGLLPDAPPMAQLGAVPAADWLAVDFTGVPRQSEVIASMERGIDHLLVP